MGWCVTILGQGLPDVNERVSSFSSCPGNMYTAVREMNDGLQLRDMATVEMCSEALIRLINELDLGCRGRFTDEWAVASDEAWSKGKETRKEFEDVRGFIGMHNLPYKDYQTFCGHTIRERIREDAIRFLLYYMAGYTVKFEW